MIEEPPVMDSLPDQPLPEEAIKDIGESDAVIGAMPFPAEQGIRGFVLEREEVFIAVVFDHRTNTWRHLEEYETDEFSLQTVLQEAIQDRAEWFAETGRLDEL
jgi:hypothetical protein